VSDFIKQLMVATATARMLTALYESKTRMTVYKQQSIGGNGQKKRAEV